MDTAVAGYRIQPVHINLFGPAGEIADAETLVVNETAHAREADRLEHRADHALQARRRNDVARAGARLQPEGQHIAGTALRRLAPQAAHQQRRLGRDREGDTAADPVRERHVMGDERPPGGRVNAPSERHMGVGRNERHGDPLWKRSKQVRGSMETRREAMRVLRPSAATPASAGPQ